MLTSSNANEMQEVCEKLMVDEIALKSFVQHREFLALKAQKRKAERTTLPDINWKLKEENEVKSLTARQIISTLSRTIFTYLEVTLHWLHVLLISRILEHDTTKEIVPMTVTQNSYPVIPNTTLILTQVLPKTTLIWIQMTPKRMFC